MMDVCLDLDAPLAALGIDESFDSVCDLFIVEHFFVLAERTLAVFLVNIV